MNANSIKAPTIRRYGAIQTSSDEKIFTVINYIFFIMLGLSTIFPFINLIAKSLSSEAAVV
jgi:putative aldouronate transport system permease protein